MKSRSPHLLTRWVIGLFAVFIFCLEVQAQDPSIDRLLSKLPPPEKLVKPRVEQAIKQNDAALNDPLTKRILAASDAGDYTHALQMARELVQKNPKSAYAQFLRGAFAFDTNQLAEASAAFHNSIAAESNHGIVHLVLGLSEMLQNHYAGAVAPLEQSGKLEPTWAVGWLLASMCEIRLGHPQQSVELAKHGTVVEPNWVYTWLQLARAEALRVIRKKLSMHYSARPNWLLIAATCLPPSDSVTSI